MYDIFGEMDSMEEINTAAGGLKSEGDKENLYKLAEENGIDRAFADMYLDGTTEDLCCDAATAALGKIDVEAAELNPVELIAEWVEYIRTLCSDDKTFAQGVRRKGKSLIGCIGSLIGWSFRTRYKVEKDIIKAAGIGNVSVEMGIPGKRTAKRLIREYYLGTGGAGK